MAQTAHVLHSAHGVWGKQVSRHSSMAVQFNLSAKKDDRDLGGVLLLMCFIILRRTWWQTAPLLEDLVADHPLLSVGFMEEAKFSGAWDRWVNVSRQYRHERAGLLRAAEGPVFSIAGLRPPHLIVARLLEPVHVRRCLFVPCLPTTCQCPSQGQLDVVYVFWSA